MSTAQSAILIRPRIHLSDQWSQLMVVSPVDGDLLHWTALVSTSTNEKAGQPGRKSVKSSSWYFLPPPGGARGTVVSSSLATQTRRQRPSAGCAWQWISRTRSQTTSSCRFRSQRQTYWCCPNVTEPLRCVLAARSMWRFTSCLPPWPMPKCVLHATQYAFAGLWLLARIPGNVLAQSLSVLAFLVR